MRIEKTSYRTRLARLLERDSTTDQRFAPLVRRFASMTLADFFGHDRARTSLVVNALSSADITVDSTLAQGMWVIERAWSNDRDAESDIVAIALCFMAQLSERSASIGLGPRLSNSKLREKTPGEKRDERLRARVASFKGTESAPISKIPLAKRLKRYEWEPPAIDSLLWLTLDDYMNAIASETQDETVRRDLESIKASQKTSKVLRLGHFGSSFMNSDALESQEILWRMILVRPLAAMHERFTTTQRESAHSGKGETSACERLAQKPLVTWQPPDEPNWKEALFNEFNLTELTPAKS